MMPTVVQEFTGNDQSVIRAYTRIIEHQRKMEAGLEKLVEKTKAVDTEQQKLERSAARLAQSLLTPHEKHAVKLREIGELQAKGLLSQEQSIRAHRLADETLRKQLSSVNDLGKGFAIGAEKALEIGAAIAGGGGIVGAIGAAKDAYWDWRQEIQTLGKEHAQFAEKFVVDLSRIADAGREQEISGWLQSGKDGTPEQKRLMFKGLSEEQPGLPLQERKAIVELSARAIPLLPAAERETFGHAVGNLYDPKLSAAANVSKTFLALRLAKDHAADLGGDRFEKLQATLSGAGMERNEATGLIIQSMVSGDQKAGALKAAAAAIDQNFELRNMPRKTADDKAKLKFAKAGREERMDLLLKDKAVRSAVLGDQGALFAGIDFKQGQIMGRQLAVAERGDTIGETLSRIEKTPEGLEVVESQRLAVEKFRNQTPNRLLGSRLERADERFESVVANENFAGRFLARMGWGLAKFWNPENPERQMTKSALGMTDAIGGETKWSDMARSAEAEEARIKEARENARRAEVLSRQQVETLKSIDRKLSSPSPAAVQNNLKQHGEGGR